MATCSPLTVGPTAWMTLGAAVVSFGVGDRVEGVLLAVWFVARLALGRGGGRWHVGAFFLAVMVWVSSMQRDGDVITAVTVALAVWMASCEDEPGGRVQPLTLLVLVSSLAEAPLLPLHVALVQLVVGPIDPPPRLGAAGFALVALVATWFALPLGGEAVRGLLLAVALGWGASLGTAVVLGLCFVPGVREVLAIEAPPGWAVIVAFGVSAVGGRLTRPGTPS